MTSTNDYGSSSHIAPKDADGSVSPGDLDGWPKRINPAESDHDSESDCPGSPDSGTRTMSLCPSGNGLAHTADASSTSVPRVTFEPPSSPNSGRSTTEERADPRDLSPCPQASDVPGDSIQLTRSDTRGIHRVSEWDPNLPPESLARSCAHCERDGLRTCELATAIEEGKNLDDDIACSYCSTHNPPRPCTFADDYDREELLSMPEAMFNRFVRQTHDRVRNWESLGTFWGPFRKSGGPSQRAYAFTAKGNAEVSGPRNAATTEMPKSRATARRVTRSQAVAKDQKPKSLQSWCDNVLSRDMREDESREDQSTVTYWRKAIRE